ncbi:hypothetical protein [Arthrobacter sp. UYCu712]|uniref:hypothetical protein n=1 Tax=Arthrobacter sp. UYCu712 TaxID=3156340 RepID=UPI0033924AD1
MPSHPQPQPKSPEWEVFRGYISTPRLGPYLAATGGNRKQAIQLYHWNIGLSGAVYESLHFFEVVLRNAIDAQLSVWNATQINPSGGMHGRDWLTDPSPLLYKLTQQGKDIREATGRAEKATKRRAAQMGHADILAQMSFGTWRFLLPDKTPGRKLLWKDALADAFPHNARAEDAVTKDVAGIHLLRNRVAHLEPLLKTGAVHVQYQSMRNVLAAIHPLMEQRFISTQRITVHISQRPPGTT